LAESEYKLGQIVRAVPSMAWVTGPGGEVTKVDQRALDYTGTRLEDFLHLGWDKLIHEDDLSGAINAFSHAVKSGTSYESVHRLRRADGEYRWHRSLGEPLRDRQERIIQWSYLSIDIDESKRAGDRLRRSEAWLSQAQRLSHTGNWVYNPTTMLYVYWSDESYKIWGFDPLQGLPSRDDMWQRIHPDDRDRVRATVQEALRQKRDFTTEFRILLPDGTVKYIEGTSHHVLSPLGALVEVFTTTVDVTQRRRAQEQERLAELERERLRATEERLAETSRLYRELQQSDEELQIQVALLQQLPVSAWTLDPDGTPDFVNHVWLEFAGQTLDFVRSHPEAWMTVVHPDDRGNVTQNFWEGVNSGRGFSFENRDLRAEDGTYRWHLNQAVPLRDKDGKVLKFVGTTTDIDAQKRTEEALAELDRAKTAFFSNVSHEFRTPLTLMLGPLDEVLPVANKRLSPEHYELLVVARRNGIRLLKLVNTLLDFARIEAGRAQASYQPTDIARFTAEIASAFDSTMKLAGLRFSVECRPIADAMHVDRDMWEKIVLNLLSNALKFTFAGEVALTLKPVDGAVELRVCDTGVGIPKEHLEHVFERFHRVESTQARGYEGTGIGLSLVKELVKLHGGSVRVESAVGVGSTFIVTIPTGKEHLQAERTLAPRTLASTIIRAEAYIEEARRWAGDASAVTVEIAMPGTSPSPTSPRESKAAEKRELIVVADDNADMRQYVARLLGERYEVHGAADGRLALEATQRLHPALVVADVMMPHLDGFALLRAIRDDSTLASTPVILLSARAGEESRVEGLEADADDYLIKPFAARELMARVAAHVKMANLRRETAEREERLRSEAELEREKLRASEERLAETSRLYGELLRVDAELQLQVDLLQQLPVSAWTVKPDGTPDFVNRVWLEFAGQTLDFVRSHPEAWMAAVHPEDRETAARSFWEGVHSQRDFAFETRSLRAKDGTYRRHLQQAVVLRDPEGKVLKFVGTTTDIDDLKRTEEALRQTQGDLAHVARVATLNAMTASIAHEVRQPLAGILNNANTCVRMLAADPPNLAGAAETVRRTIRDANRAQEMIARLRAMFSKKALTLEMVDLNDAAREVIVLSAGELQRRRALLQTDFADHLPPVRADRVQLQQVILNLLLNAAEAMTGVEDRSRVVLVQTRLQDDGSVRMDVRDSGPGVDPKTVDRLFEAFYTTKPDGMGIGLSICRSIIESHDGRLSATANEGPGATFSFSIPGASRDA
jgi:PAS domain S-box-containing protein